MRFVPQWRMVLLVLVVLFSTAPVQAQPEPIPEASVHPVLAQQMARSAADVSFLVILKAQPNPEQYLSRHELRASSLATRRASLYTYLTAFAAEQQRDLRVWLEARGVSYRPFYLVNAIEVTGDVTLLAALQQRPEVDRLVANPTVRLVVPEDLAPDIPRSRTLYMPEIPYGIRYTNAPQVWEMGYTGQGIVLASQDTGVDWQHPALKSNYRGWDEASQTASHPYNWFDAWGTLNRSKCDPDPQVPCDDGDHGTHTVGTLVGNDSTLGPNGTVVGMAPDAEWIGCRNMNGGNGTPASYMACFEFFFAPYPQNGTPDKDGNSSLAPDIINNSWYCPPQEGCDFESLRQTVQTMRSAGILVVASAGNDGERNLNNGVVGCSTVRFPISAYAEVFSVGSHNSDGNISGFSSRGPVTADGSHRLKPEITAPGGAVYSTVPGSGYSTKSGTSMAAPHVAGAVALLWSAAPHLKGQLDETEEILMKSATSVAVPDYVVSFDEATGKMVCKAGTTAEVPNATYGFGRLNVKAAVDMAQHPAVLTVTVSANREAQVANARVTLKDKLTKYTYEGSTDATGSYTFGRLYSGDYLLTVTQNGHTVTTEVTLTAGATKAVTVAFERSLFLPYVHAE